MLLAASGLIVRSLINAKNIDVGFNPNNALAISFDLGLEGYDRNARERFFDTALQRVRALPTVEAAGLAGYLPLALDSSSRGVQVDGYTPPQGQTPLASYTRI